jgi:hypothetical protein
MVKVAEWVSRDIFEGVGRLCAYYSYLQGAVAQAIWLELRLVHDEGHPVTDGLQLADSLKLLLAIHERNRNDEVAVHLRGLRKRVIKLVGDRNLLVHGMVIFDAGNDGGTDPGVRWLIRRGGYNRKPQPVTLKMVIGLIEECKALTDDISTIGRFNSTRY